MKIFYLLFSTILLSCSQVNSSESPKNGTLYLRTYMWTGMYGSSLDISWIYLGKDGKIVRNPKHGVDPVNWEKEKTDNAKNVGTYTEKGSSLEIKWSDGKTAKWTIERKSSEVTAIDGGIVSIPDRMPSNYKIEGQYAASTVLPNVSNSQTLVFKKDGTFNMANLGTIATADVSASSESASKGSYDISGNTLTFKFANGEVKKSVICIWDMDGVKNLVINSRYYPREK